MVARSRNRLACLALFYALATPALGQVDPPADPPAETPKQSASEAVAAAQALFDKQDYRACLVKINTALPPAPKGEAAVSPDRYPLLMLRAECMIRLKQRDPAGEAAQQAVAAATDSGDRAKAAALAALIKSSPALVYREPGTPVDKGLDLSNLEQREKAMKSLLALRIKTVTDSVDKAVAGSNLTAVRNAIPAVAELAQLERSGDPEAPTAVALSAKLAGKVRESTEPIVARISTRTRELQRLATTINESHSEFGVHRAYRGITSIEDGVLRDMLTTVNDVRALGEAGRAMENRGVRDKSPWDAVRTSGAQAGQSIQSLLDRFGVRRGK